MFTCSFKQSGEETVTIEIEEGSYVAAIVLILRYLCMSAIENHSNNVFEVLAAAGKLQLSGLCHSCEASVCSTWKGSVCSTWKASHVLGLS